ncbi:hypothetical protein A2U01_0045069, partial [Trifolium medium]|nr:hypothetical protein [Trifolium medium]
QPLLTSCLQFLGRQTFDRWRRFRWNNGHGGFERRRDARSGGQQVRFRRRLGTISELVFLQLGETNSLSQCHRLKGEHLATNRRFKTENKTAQVARWWQANDPKSNC